MFFNRYLRFDRILLYWIIFIIIIIIFVNGQRDNDDDSDNRNSIQFNVDFKFPIIIDPIEQHKQHGFDNIPVLSSLVAIKGQDGQHFMLMGSPNFYESNNDLITGAVFSCPVMAKSTKCERILVNDNGNKFIFVH